MEYKNLIKASSKVVQITELSKWDIFKWIKESDYWSPELFFGIVTEIMNNWEKWYISAIKLKSGYSEISKEVILLTEKEMDKVAIFPSSYNEMKLALSECIENLDRKIKDKGKELDKMKEDFIFSNKIISGELFVDVNTPKYIEN